MNAEAEGGVKHDSGKPRMELLDPLALQGLAQVLTFGASKYPGPHNWRKGFAYSRLLGAALRHIFAFMNGQDTDKESGLSHIDHALACLMFLSNHVKTGIGKDDRYKASLDT